MTKTIRIINALSVDRVDQPGTGLFNFKVIGGDDMEVNDGSHSFDELYQHRYKIFIALCRILSSDDDFKTCEVWKSKQHADGTMHEGYFLMGIYKDAGRQISYHLPIEYWNEIPLAQELERAPEWDGHTPADVIKRLSVFDGL